MNFFKKPITFLAVALLAMPISGFSQYHFEVDPLLSYFRDPLRYELGFNYIVPFGEFAGVTRVMSGSVYQGDTTTKRSITAAAGYGAEIGLSLPFKATGHISCWAASFHLRGSMYSWQDLNATQTPDGTLNPQAKSLNATTICVALPIGIDWKIGNDAILTKRLPFGTSLGAGLTPQVDITSLESVSNVDSKMSFGCTPYVKAELSIFAGLDVKLRAVYTIGNITLIDVNKAIPGTTDGPFKISSTGNVLLSLIFMPFSGGWHEWAWYNTFDNYNQHDRLN
jgi:hypothetical protein